MNYCIPDMTAGDYFASDGLSATVLKACRTSMKHGRHQATVGREQTAAMAWGSLVHGVVLEPDLFFDTLAVWNGDKRGKAWSEFKADAEGQHLSVVTVDEMKDLTAISASVHGNRHANRLISQTQHEMSAFWGDDHYGPAKCRFDCICDDMALGIADIKTTRNITARLFGMDFFRMGYDLQFGWYREGARVITGKVLPVHVICIESSAPFDCCVRRVPESVMDAGLERGIELARKYRICEHLNRWDGVSSEIDDIEVPGWMGGSERVELTMGGEKVEV